MQKLYGLIGHPVEHSMSPVMHNASFKELGIPGYYHAFNVHPHDLESAIAGMKALDVAGFNVTIPHKINCMKYLDKIDDLAMKIGAVNTVVNENGKFVGYNTDGPGFVRALKEETHATLLDKNILIIGAGGAARGIFMTLASSGGGRIDIANRTVSRAEELISDCSYPVQSVSLSLEQAEKRLENYDIIVNTTSIGLHPNVSELPISLERLGEKKIVCDIIYNPLETMFLKQAKEKGAIVQNGLGMFVYQGALAFEKWEGKFPNIELMKQVVLDKLGGKTC